MSDTTSQAATSPEGPALHSAPDTTSSAEPPSLLGYPATYALVGCNIALFLWMSRFGPFPALIAQVPPLLHGLHTGLAGFRMLASWLAELFTAPFSERLLTTFGACTTDRVLASGEWWRLVSSIFVHVTLLHPLLNMWCLWNLGLFGEPLLGKPGLVAVYLLTGVAGMLQSVLVSLFTGRLGLVVAGASGAVFGIAGILIVLLSNKKLAAPWAELRSLRRQVIFFALANLLLGALPALLPRISPGIYAMLHLAPGTLPSIDNGAHVGGFLCGLALGVPLFPRMTSGRSSYRVRQALVFGAAALALVLVSYAVAVFARSLSA